MGEGIRLLPSLLWSILLSAERLSIPPVTTQLWNSTEIPLSQTFGSVPGHQGPVRLLSMSAACPAKDKPARLKQQYDGAVIPSQTIQSNGSNDLISTSLLCATMLKVAA
jgi:hypothetical protein